MSVRVVQANVDFRDHSVKPTRAIAFSPWSSRNQLVKLVQVLSNRLKLGHNSLEVLSAGMSDDFEGVFQVFFHRGDDGIEVPAASQSELEHQSKVVWISQNTMHAYDGSGTSEPT